MDIKEIALRIGEEADDYADAKLQSKGEFHPDWHTVRDEYFAEALIAELAACEQRVAEACALQVATETRFHLLDAARVAKEIRSGEWRKFVKEV